MSDNTEQPAANLRRATEAQNVTTGVLAVDPASDEAQTILTESETQLSPTEPETQPTPTEPETQPTPTEPEAQPTLTEPETQPIPTEPEAQQVILTEEQKERLSELLNRGAYLEGRPLFPSNNATEDDINGLINQFFPDDLDTITDLAIFSDDILSKINNDQPLAQDILRIKYLVETFLPMLYEGRNGIVAAQIDRDNAWEEISRLFVNYMEYSNWLNTVADLLHEIVHQQENDDDEFNQIPFLDEDEEDLRATPAASDTNLLTMQHTQEDIDKGKGHCTVCLEDFVAKVSLLECPGCHKCFHEQCILKSLRRGNVCALCRCQLMK